MSPDPTLPQEPKLDTPIPPSTSEPVEVPPEAINGPTEAESAVSFDAGPIFPDDL